MIDRLTAPGDALRLRGFQLSFLLVLAANCLFHNLWSVPFTAETPYRAIPWMQTLIGPARLPYPLYLISCAAFIIGSVAAAFGQRPKLFLAIGMIGFFFYRGTLLGCDAHFLFLNRASRISNLVLPVYLLLLCSPRSILEVPVRRIFTEPALNGRAPTLFLIKLTLGIFYFATGFGKIRADLSWLNGQTAQSLLLESWATGPSAVIWFLANNDFLCRAASVVTVAAELLAPVILFLPFGDLAFVAAGLFFHLLVLWLLKINFFLPTFISIYLVFLPPAWLKRIVPAMARAPAKN